MLLYASIINRLSNQHEAIEKIINGMADAQLQKQPQSGKWSIKDNIAHLAKYQPVFMERMELVIKGERPSFGRYIADEDPQFADWKSWDIQTLLERLNADRQLIYDLIINCSGKQVAFTGIHKRFGELTLVQWTEFFLLHEAHHLFMIFQLVHNNEL
jgi:hypothetical protein